MNRVLLMIALAAAGCSSQEQSSAREAPASTSRESATSSPSKAQTSTEQDASSKSVPKKEERGNTPPGQTRAGEAPAQGTIDDPTGATKR